jgi:hypothetical protein
MGGVYWQPVYAVLETALSDSMHLLVGPYAS